MENMTWLRAYKNLTYFGNEGVEDESCIFSLNLGLNMYF